MAVDRHLLTTKLYAPSPRVDHVVRPRLAARLHAGVRAGHRLFLLSAPAGYGKTTLLSSWLQEQERTAHDPAAHPAPAPSGATHRRVAWLSLDAGDNDPLLFFNYLIGALARIDPGIGAIAAGMLGSPQPPAAPVLATMLLNDLARLDALVTLVLDDYQALTNVAVHDVVALMIERAPPSLRIILLTRVDPPLPLARLRARNLVTELRAADLRFTTAEAETFFRRTMGLELSDGEIRVLGERTEGWVAGLQLAALSLRERDRAQASAFVAAFGGSHHYVVDYLVDEVLHFQDKRVRSFLRAAAVLDRFCAPLCDVLTARNDAQLLLGQLERANLFLVPLDDQRKWFRFHQLFADTLRAELDAVPQLRAELQGRAALWLAANGDFREAIPYALTAEDWEHASRWIRQIADEGLYGFDYGRLSAWIDALPDAVVRREPELLLLRALFAYVARPPDEGRRVLAELDHVRREQLSPRSWGRLQHMRAVNAMLREAPAAIPLLQEALALIDDDDLFFRQRTTVALGRAHRLAGDSASASAAFAEAIELGRRLQGPANTFHAAQLLALIMLDQGRRMAAQELCTRLLAECAPGAGASLPTSELLLAPLAACAYEANELQQAYDLALRAREEYRRYGLQQRGLIAPDITLILASAALGRWDEAWRSFDELYAAPTESQWTGRVLALLAVELRLRRGEIDEATSWLQLSAARRGSLPEEVDEAHDCAAARLLLAQARPDAAQQLLAPLEAQAQAGGRGARLITLQLLQARAAAALGLPEAAARHLARALQLAAPEGYLRRFLDEGPALAALLTQNVERGTQNDPLRAYTLALLAAFGVANGGEAVRRPTLSALESELRAAGKSRSDAPATSAEGSIFPKNALGLPEPLTPQELKVLRALDEGLTYQEIADRLVLSASTVRWHVHNTYAKLASPRRAQALRRARELGLL